jgi:hypothetical protein
MFAGGPAGDLAEDAFLQNLLTARLNIYKYINYLDVN